jgi:hypothetical protein
LEGVEVGALVGAFLTFLAARVVAAEATLRRSIVFSDLICSRMEATSVVAAAGAVADMVVAVSAKHGKRR